MNLSINLHNYAFGVTSDKSGIIVVYLKKRREAGSKACCRGSTALSKKARDCRQKKTQTGFFKLRIDLQNIYTTKIINFL